MVRKVEGQRKGGKGKQKEAEKKKKRWRDERAAGL